MNKALIYSLISLLLFYPTAFAAEEVAKEATEEATEQSVHADQLLKVYEQRNEAGKAGELEKFNSFSSKRLVDLQKQVQERYGTNSAERLKRSYNKKGYLPDLSATRLTNFMVSDDKTRATLVYSGEVLLPQRVPPEALMEHVIDFIKEEGAWKVDRSHTSYQNRPLQLQ